MCAGSGRVWESRARCESPSQQATRAPVHKSFLGPRCVRSAVRKNAETRQKHYKWDASHGEACSVREETVFMKNTLLFFL